MDEPMNILYIMTDQQRYDTVSCHGRSACRTPHLDRLAAEGVRFDNAYSICALCSPARSSMLTGLLPHNHRMLANNDMMCWTIRNLPDGVRLISEDLVEAGYNCGYSGKWHCGRQKLPSTYGFVGMDVPDYGNPYATKEYADYLAARGLERPKVIEEVMAGGTLGGPLEACATHFIAQFAIDLIRSFNEERAANGKPFMMFVSFCGPHARYNVPEPYASMYNPDDVELWANFRDDLPNKPAIHKRLRDEWGQSSRPAKDWQRTIAKYWGYCTFIDDEIGRLLDTLGELGRQNDTAVFFSTDHGDMTGSHGGFFDKGPYMYEETYHIPLMARIPGLTSPGAVCDRLVSNMDLATTALDAAGLPLPENHDGRSLMPLFRNPNADWPDDLVCEFHGHQLLYSQRMLRWDRYKYVSNPPDIDELYDLEADPHELVNRIGDPVMADVAEECRRRLLAWIERTDDGLKHVAGMMLGGHKPWSA